MSPNKHNESLQKLSQCISDIMAWSSSNKLKLNQSKTEILHITSQFRNSGDLPSLDIAGVDVISSKNVRDLGVIIDNKLNMQQHIRKTCRAAAFGISKIGKIRKFLNRQSTERLIQLHMWIIVTVYTLVYLRVRLCLTFGPKSAFSNVVRAKRCCVHAYFRINGVSKRGFRINSVSKRRFRGAAFLASLKLVKYVNFLIGNRLSEIIHAFVTSHVDYCNSLYSGLPNSTLAPLQHVQNTAARLVTKSRKHEHITPEHPEFSSLAPSC